MIGQLLTGRYLILEKLGTGGFSETYLARDKYLPQHPLCVVKRLKLPLDSKISLETARHLFENEAYLLGQLGQNYSQIPTLFAYGQEQDSTYLVQEYIEGESLSTWLNSQKRFTVKAAIALLMELLPVLDYVHSHQAIHCDITPSNIIRRCTGEIVLIDFGAAHYCSETGRNLDIPLLIGTPGYIPDEQCLGMPQMNSDIYALGILVIHLLTRTDPQQFKQDLISGELDWQRYLKAGALPSNFLAILNRMVRSRSSDRYQQVSEVLSDLQQLQQDSKASTSLWSRAQPAIFTASTVLLVGTGFLQLQDLERRYGRSVKSIVEQFEQQLFPETEHRLTRLREVSMRSGIDQLLIAPNKRVMVSVGTDRRLRLWSLPHSKLIATLAADRSPVTTLAISPDSKFLVSGRKNGTLQLWDIDRGQLLRQFRGHQQSVIAIAFSPGLKTLTSSGKDRTIRHWDLQTGELLKTQNFPSADVIAMTYPSPDRLITASSDRQLRVWNLHNGEIERTFSGHTDEIVSLQIVNDHTLVSFGKDRGLVWDLKREILAQALPKASADSIMVSKCDRHLMTVHKDGSIRAWIPKDGKLVMQEAGKLDNPKTIAFSPAHDYLVSWNTNQRLSFWQIPDRVIH